MCLQITKVLKQNWNYPNNRPHSAGKGLSSYKGNFVKNQIDIDTQLLQN